MAQPRLQRHESGSNARSAEQRLPVIILRVWRYSR